MNKIPLKSFCLIAFLISGFASASTAMAGNGHVDRSTDVTVESVSSDGLRQIKVSNSVLGTEEIKFLDLARKHLILNFGNEAENWPIMIDLKNKRVVYSEPKSNTLTEILFANL